MATENITILGLGVICCALGILSANPQNIDKQATCDRYNQCSYSAYGKYNITQHFH